MPEVSVGIAKEPSAAGCTVSIANVLLPSRSVGSPQSCVGTKTVERKGVSVFGADSGGRASRNRKANRAIRMKPRMPSKTRLRIILVLFEAEGSCLIVDLPH